jgi:hypothetical protein
VWQGQLTTEYPGARDPSDPYIWYEYVAAICAIEWGLYHIFLAFTIAPVAFANNLSNTLTSFYDALDEVDSAAITHQFAKTPRFTCRVLCQHALNLGWIGGFAILAPFMVADETFCRYAWWCFLPCFLNDVCCWVCLDVPDLMGAFNKIQPYIVSIGLWCFALSVYERFEAMGEASPDDLECFIMFLMPLIFFGLLIIQTVLSLLGVSWGGMGCFICEDTEKPEPPPEKPEEPEEEEEEVEEKKVLDEIGYHALGPIN